MLFTLDTSGRVLYLKKLKEDPKIVPPFPRTAEILLSLKVMKYLTEDELVKMSLLDLPGRFACLGKFNEAIEFLEQKDASQILEWSQKQGREENLTPDQKMKSGYVASVIYAGEHYILTCKTVSMHSCMQLNKILLKYKYFRFIVRQTFWGTPWLKFVNTVEFEWFLVNPIDGYSESARFVPIFDNLPKYLDQVVFQKQKQIKI